MIDSGLKSSFRKVKGVKLSGSYLAKVSKKGLILAVDGALPDTMSLRVGSEVLVGSEKLLREGVYYLSKVSECQMVGRRKYRISIQISGVLKVFDLEKDGISGSYFWSGRLDDEDLPPFDYVAYIVEVLAGIDLLLESNVTSKMEESFRDFNEKYRRRAFRE